MITDKNYYTVCGWMRSRLHLSGSELIVYALIYSFSQDGETGFHGSLSYLQEFTGLSKSTLLRVILRLMKKGYIKKYSICVGNKLSCCYSAVMECDGFNLNKKCQNDNDVVSKCESSVVKMTPNIDNNINRQDERKKERNNKNHEPINARAREEEDYSQISDEELLAAGEQGAVDWDDEESVNQFYRYYEECKKRQNESKWEGKIIKGHGVFEKLKSHEEILDEMKIKGPLRTTFLRFLRECYLNGHLVSNEKLIDIISRLSDSYGCGAEADQKKIQKLETAINGGYFDIR